MAVINGTVVGAEAGFYPKELEQSLRFNDDDSAYLSWTPASAGNRKTWTWSGWVKRGDLGSVQRIFSADDGSASTDQDYNSFFFTSSDQLQFGGNLTNFRITSAVYRDVGSWYHIVLVTDTTDATATDRFKLYVNGEQVTSFGTENNPSQNTDLAVNAAIGHYIASIPSGNYLDGYLAEVHFTDGTAYDADDFGEFKNGVWVAKAFTGSYGTNGFYLDFADGGALGNDVSGNNNDWTATNLASTDVMLDSPTNNFATLNPLVAEGSANTFYEGNLKVYTGSGGPASAVGTLSASSGKWYFETLIGSGTSTDKAMVGITDPNGFNPSTENFWDTSSGYGYYSANGDKFNVSDSAYGATYTDGDVIGVAFDLDAGTLTFYKNGVSQGTAYTGISGTFTGVVADGGGTASETMWVNFGQDSSFAGNKTPQGYTDANGRGDFYYAPPSGYLALCTANLPEPAIGPNSATTADEHFYPATYSGTSASQDITSPQFQPDMVWIKSRSNASNNYITDSVRGNTKGLQTNITNAEVTNTDVITSFNSDGFTLGTDATANVANISGRTYVAWNWKADNTSGSSNTDGSITSTVAANVDAGFSIVSYTGNGSGSQSIGHGLNQAPELVIVKKRQTGTYNNWPVWHTDFGINALTYLNLTNGKITETGATPTLPTASVYYLGTGGAAVTIYNENAKDFIAYCFHSVEGYSKIGSYTATQNADGPFVYTGFRPAFIIAKNVSRSQEWVMLDNTRNTYNVVDKYLFPNYSNAEPAGGNYIDFTSNGFKVRDSGSSINYASGDTIIYVCFAESPFKYSNAR